MLRIVQNRKIMVGKPVIRGTRVPVDLVLNLLAHGYTPTRVVEAYPQLTLADIRAVREYKNVSVKEKVFT